LEQDGARAAAARGAAALARKGLSVPPSLYGPVRGRCCHLDECPLPYVAWGNAMIKCVTDGV
jgi:hypothetical protein